MAKKEYRFEIEVSRGWGGVEQIRIATGTDSVKELNFLVNELAESMQDRADNHQKQLMKVEEAVRQAQEAQAQRNEENEAAEAATGAEIDNNIKE